MKVIEKIWEIGGKSLEWTEDNPVFEVETYVLYTDGSRWQYKGFIADAVNELIKIGSLDFTKWVIETYTTDEGRLPLSGNTKLGGQTIFIDHTEYPFNHTYDLYKQSK